MSRPAPKEPKPLRPEDDPKTGHFQLVVSFRVERMAAPMDRWLRNLRSILTQWGNLEADGFTDLTVHVRVIGAGGEASEHEGLWPPDSLSTTEDLPLARTARDEDIVTPREGLL